MSLCSCRLFAQKSANNHNYILIISRFVLVGATGFEPATTWSQTRCATGLRYTPRLRLQMYNFISISLVFLKKTSDFGSPEHDFGEFCVWNN